MIKHEHDAQHKNEKNLLFERIQSKTQRQKKLMIQQECNPQHKNEKNF